MVSKSFPRKQWEHVPCKEEVYEKHSSNKEDWSSAFGVSSHGVSPACKEGGVETAFRTGHLNTFSWIKPVDLIVSGARRRVPVGIFVVDVGMKFVKKA
eukprot:scaffold53450_cov15-Tisochrysis_lutea.AAC.1